jgi:diguanylate cyclase (GGDEF)-like protein
MFGTLNLIFGTLLLALIELATVCYAGLILYMSRHTAFLKRWILAFTLPLFSGVMVGLFTARETATIFVWVLFIPILSHLLLGRRLGLVVSVIFVAIGAGIFWLIYQDSAALIDVLPLSNLITVTLLVLAFSNLYEAGWERSERALIRMAQTDFLTGLANRSWFLEAFEQEKRRAHRHGSPFSVLAIDLDHFKSVNDQHGHEAGDLALVELARLLADRLRATDMACRMGGEEFSVILVDTATPQAQEVAEELRRALEATVITHGDATIRLTMSIGIVEFDVDGVDIRDLLHVADQRLYQAKDNGRNRVVAGIGAGKPTPKVTIKTDEIAASSADQCRKA